MPRRLVLVTGPPGSGKSTVARDLASALEMPLVMKDAIKEAIHDGLGRPELTFSESQRLGAASFEVMWAVARSAPAIVLECNFDRDNSHQLRQLRALHPTPVEVFCRCPPDLAAKRYRDRHARGERHPVHVVADIPADVLARFAPLGLGPVVEADTSKAVDVARVASQVASLLEAAR